jgi:hypothetical protein
MKYRGRKGVTSNVSTYTRNEYDPYMNIKTPSRSHILVIYWLDQNTLNAINWKQVTFTLIKTKLLLKRSLSCRNYDIYHVFWSLLLIRKKAFGSRKGH